MLQPERQRHFLQLARDGALLRQEQILGELLRQRRAALRGAVMQHIGEGRARDAERIDRVVRIEAAILDGDEGVRHIGRQFAQRNSGAAHIAARRQGRAIVAEDQDRRRPFGNFQRLDRRQVDTDPHDHARDGDHAPQRQHGAPVDDAADAQARLAGALTGAFAGAALAFREKPEAARAPPATAAARFGRAADAVLRTQPHVEAAGIAGALTAALSPCHAASPGALPRAGITVERAV